MTLLASRGMSRSMMPPCWLALRAFECFLAVLIPLTRSLLSAGKTCTTSPSWPLSLPEITFTVSPLRIFMSEHLRCQGNDAHELLVAQLTADWAEDARAARG